MGEHTDETTAGPGGGLDWESPPVPEKPGGAGVKPATDAPPYRSVRHAVHSAYASEVAAVWGRNLDLYDLGKDDENEADDNLTLQDFIVSDYLEALPHDPAGDYRDDLAAYEWVAEGHWTLALIRQTLSTGLRHVVDARFTIPTEPTLHVHKDAACTAVTKMVCRAETYGKPPAAYVRATVFDWAGLGKRNDEAAQDELSVTARTLQRWRNGESFSDGIVCTLNGWIDDAEAALFPAMAARGLIAVRADGLKCDNGTSINTHK